MNIFFPFLCNKLSTISSTWTKVFVVVKGLFDETLPTLSND